MAQAPWLLMIETDYVWMKPLQAPPAQDPASRGAAFPFGYITPAAPALEGVMRKMYAVEMGPTSDIPGTGPAPVMMRFAEWLEVGLEAPTPFSGRRPVLAGVVVVNVDWSAQSKGCCQVPSTPCYGQGKSPSARGGCRVTHTAAVEGVHVGCCWCGPGACPCSAAIALHVGAHAERTDRGCGPLPLPRPRWCRSGSG